MGSIWTVTPDDVKIELVYEPEGGQPTPFWIKVKKLLSVGEDRAVKTAGWRSVSGGVKQPGTDDTQTEIKIDWKSSAFSRSFTYLTDWSLTDDKDRKMPLKLDTIEALHPAVFELIENAITAHVEAQTVEKKATTGSPSPQPTSGS